VTPWETYCAALTQVTAAQEELAQAAIDYRAALAVATAASTAADAPKVPWNCVFKSNVGLICGNEMWLTIATTGLKGGDSGHGGWSSVKLSFDCLNIDVAKNPGQDLTGFVVTAKGDWETQLLAASLMMAGSQLAKGSDLSWFQIHQMTHHLTGDWVEEGEK
jgi:hypothetical protein